MEKKHLFIGLASALGAVSVTFISLFVWKSVSNGNTPVPQVTEHFVTFESYGGGHFPTQRVKDGETATEPEKTPIRGNDTFLGWFVDFNQPAYTFKEKVNEDITLYAGWDEAPDPVTSFRFKFTGHDCKVNGLTSFECNIGIGAQTQFAIIPDDEYTFPPKDNEHWKVKEGEETFIYEPSTGYIKIGGMTSNIEIEATAVPVKTYTIEFYDGDTKIEGLDQTVEYNHRVQRPVNPIKEGHTFDDWYTTAKEGETLYPFDVPLTGEETVIKIYARFTLNDCNITYVLSGCTIEGTTSVKYGATIPTEPTVKIGDKQIYPTWWKTPNFTEGSQFTFGEAGTGEQVKDDLILYGKYVPTAESFVNDSWDLFTSYIDGKTFGEISGEGSSYHGEYVNNGNTFVGLSRTLEFTNEKGEPIVRHALVVDENPSAEANDNKFTFMITDLGLETTFAESSNFYKESYINSYLDILLWMFPAEVKQHMVTNSIDCYNADPDISTIVSLETSLYIPSASQIFGENESAYPTENGQFAYFENGDKTILNNAWLRTPDKDTQALSLYVNSGNISEDEITASHSLMPVFVIK